MKMFYTEKDIDNMHADGVVEIEIDDDTVLTDLAREKAIKINLHMKQVEKRRDQSKIPGISVPHMIIAPQTQLSPDAPDSLATVSTSASSLLSDYDALDPELISSIKASVIAKLGNDIAKYDSLLDQIISTVLIMLNPK